MKNFIFLLIIFLTAVSCGSFKDAGKVLRNEKIKTTDEFLVEKKNPLVLPPDYQEIPKPGSIIKKGDEKEKLKKILKGPEIDKNSINKSTSIEKSILDKIRK